MTTSKKKNIRWKALSVPLIVGAVGVWTFLGMNWLWDLSSANSSSISESNRVSVEGVENSAQYLTSMVLHMGDEWPNDTKVVTLYYDTGAKALHISGNVNANALIIGNKNEALSGTTAIGGEGNKIQNGSENALIMGGKDNSLASATNSIILGGRGTAAASANNLAIIGASETRVPTEGISAPKKENILVAGGHGNVVRWSNVVILWEGNNEAGSDSVLIGKNIKAGNAQKVFVWSDDGTFSPKKSGAFYVNTKNGIWFNTNDPKVKFDIGGLGGKWAIKIAAKWGFVSASGKCDEQYAGLMAYVKAWGKSGLCGCNGVERVPLSSDPSTHGVCVNMNQRQCAGWEQNTIKTTPVQALPKWNPELNEGDGGWEEVKWVYGGIQYPGSTGKECGYTCQTGYHAGVDFPDGWQMWGCLPSTEIPNRYTGEKPDGSTFNGWWTPGTGNDNCHFGCKAGYKHKDQPGVERSCSGCNIGTYTPENNQRAECKDCVMPTINKQGLQEFITHASTRGGTATTINSGFKAWTTTGYSEYSCNFHCDERFAYKHDTNTTGSCSFCQPGTYSSGGVAQCASCTPIANATFTTNGTKNRKDAGATRLDCDFNCKWGYVYKNNGGTDRSCTACYFDQGTWTRSPWGQTTECKPCDAKPANSHYTGGPFTTQQCNWECDAGYYPRGWACVKATWQRRTRTGCNNSWRRKDGYKETYQVCSDGLWNDNVPAAVCNHRWTQQNGSRTPNGDTTCNPPWWTGDTCGDCNGRCWSVSVSCSKRLVDAAGTTHNTSTRSESRYCGACATPPGWWGGWWWGWWGACKQGNDRCSASWQCCNSQHICKYNSLVGYPTCSSNWSSSWGWGYCSSNPLCKGGVKCWEINYWRIWENGRFCTYNGGWSCPYVRKGRGFFVFRHPWDSDIWKSTMYHQGWELRRLNDACFSDSSCTHQISGGNPNSNDQSGIEISKCSCCPLSILN